MSKKQIAVDVDDEDFVLLAREAERQAVPIEELLGDIICRLADSLRNRIDST